MKLAEKSLRILCLTAGQRFKTKWKKLIGRKKDVVRSVHEVFAQDSLTQATCLKQMPVIRI